MWVVVFRVGGVVDLQGLRGRFDGLRGRFDGD
jgi:hypothetical protein